MRSTSADGRITTRLAVGLASVALLIGLLPASTVLASVSEDALFEGADGNLVDNNPPANPIDWNVFAPLGWPTTGAPYRQATTTSNGWKVVGIEDAADSGTDTVFAGGTKQDDECATVRNGPKPPNKDDLERIYLASKLVAGTPDKVYLALGWVRIPQNTTSASAHVAFEFNQLDPDVAANQCGGGSDGLVKRSTANGGDLLIVYDFEGGTSAPQIKLSRWIASGTCEVGSSSPPCWGNATNLTANTFADAAVNVGSPALDAIGPVEETLGDSEFGEAIIDLSAAGVFPTVGCLTFGNVFGVSRSSGNSAQAAMKDLVGPGDSGLSNCGKIELVKDFSADAPSNARANLFIKKGGTTDGVDSEANAADGGTTGENEVRAGSYDISETAGTNTDFANYGTTVACVDEASSNASVTVTSQVLTGTTRSGTVSVGIGSDVKCTFTNTLLTGAIEVVKTGKDARCTGVATPNSNCKAAGDAYLAGAKFEIWKETNGIADLQTTTGTPDTKVKTEQTTGSAGTTCFGGLVFGDYYALETAAPTGYKIDAATSAKTSVSASGSCPSTGTVLSVSFTNTPLTTIQVKVTSLAGAGVTVSQIVCKQGTTVISATSENGSADNETTPVRDDTDETFGNGTGTLVPGVYTCTIDVDP